MSFGMSGIGFLLVPVPGGSQCIPNQFQMPRIARTRFGGIIRAE
jgi:hypothetical protein